MQIFPISYISISMRWRQWTKGTKAEGEKQVEVSPHIRGDVADSELCVNLCVTDTVYKPPSVFPYWDQPPSPPMA